MDNTEEQIKTRIQEALAAQAEVHRKESADKELLIIAGFEGCLQQSLVRTCTSKITTEYNNSVLSSNSVVESSLSITTEIEIVEKYEHLDSSLNEILFQKYAFKFYLTDGYANFTKICSAHLLNIRKK